MGKANKSINMRTQILFKLGNMFLSGKNEEESQYSACKINTLKADISPSSDLQILLSLFTIQCNTCSKKFLMKTHYNDGTKHIQNCPLNISPPSSLLVTTIFNILDNNIPRWRRMPHYTC